MYLLFLDATSVLAQLRQIFSHPLVGCLQKLPWNLANMEQGLLCYLASVNHAGMMTEAMAGFHAYKSLEDPLP